MLLASDLFRGRPHSICTLSLYFKGWQQMAFMADTCRWGPEQLPDVWGGNQWLSHSPAVVCRCCPDCNRPGPPLPCPSKAWPAAESSWGQNRRGGRRSRNVWGGCRRMMVIWSFLYSLCCYFPRTSLSRKCWRKGFKTWIQLASALEQLQKKQLYICVVLYI